MDSSLFPPHQCTTCRIEPKGDEETLSLYLKQVLRQAGKGDFILPKLQFTFSSVNEFRNKTNDILFFMNRQRMCIMVKNIGTADRVIRLVIGLVIIAAGIYFKSWWGLLGLVSVGTALVSFCGLYTLLGISTCKRAQQDSSLYG